MQLAYNKENISIGKNSHDNSYDIANLNHENLFRLPASYHQKYKVVDATEDDFSTHINWRHELDEMVRLIGEEGLLKIRCGQNVNMNMLSVKNFLGRRLGLEVTIEEETPLWAKKISNKEKWTKDDYITTTTFRIKRKNLEIYQDKSWTFAVLTSGSKVENVVKFCASIRKLDPQTHHQILICGPRHESYEQYGVDYVSNLEKFRNDYAEICAKKNSIIDHAKNQNLLICHDRYFLAEDFFTGFEQYGYDFDFLSVNTLEKETNAWFQHYVKMGYIKHEFKWHKEWYCFKDKDFAKNNELYPVFINGGLNIFKRDVIKEIRYNPCFFWHQVEDVELSMEFSKHHLIPRSNMFSTVFTSKRSFANFGINIETYEDINGGEIRIPRKKLNKYKRLRRGIFKKLYQLITNKKLLNYLETEVLRM